LFSGKSTLIGRLMVENGDIDKRTVDVSYSLQ